MQNQNQEKALKVGQVVVFKRVDGKKIWLKKTFSGSSGKSVTF